MSINDIVLFDHVKAQSVMELLELNHFYVDNNGFLCRESDTPKSLINQLIFPIKEITISDGLTENKSYLIGAINLVSGKRLPELVVAANAFASMRWLSNWGLVANVFAGSGNKDWIRNAIQCLFSLTTQEIHFTHLGMRVIQGETIYVHANGTIWPKDSQVKSDKIIAEITEKRLQGYKLERKDELVHDAIQQSLNLLYVAPLPVTYSLLAITYLAPLCDLLRKFGHEPKFVLWVYGATGSRKTTLASLFLSHYGNFVAGTPPCSFKDTINSLEKRFFLCKDSLMLVDDYHPSTNLYEARTMEQAAQIILRYYGDRIGRGRMKSDTGLYDDYPPRGMAIVTGEDLISGHSSMARLFPIEVLKDDVDLKELTEGQQNAPLLVYGMHAFIEWLISEHPLEEAWVESFFNDMRSQYASRFGHGRMLDTIACLLLGLYCFFEFAVTKGIISETEQESMYNEAEQIFLTIAETQSRAMAEQRPSEKFLEVVRSLLDSGSIYTKQRPNKTVHQRPEVMSNATQVGWHDDQFLYFYPDIIYSDVVQFLKKQGEHFPTTKTMLWKYLEQDGAIEIEIETDRIHRLVSVRIDKHKARYLKVRYDAIYSEDKVSPLSPLIEDEVETY